MESTYINSYIRIHTYIHTHAQAKDKVDKVRLAEISIEHRLRSEELATLSAIHTSTTEKQHSVNTDLSLAKVP